MRKKRWEYLDIIKTIAIICVCAYHFQWIGNNSYSVGNISVKVLNNRFWTGMWSICIPLFFMVNGALLLNKKKLNCRKHLKKIVFMGMIFLIWRGITILMLGSVYGILKTSSIKEIIGAIIFGGNIIGIDVSHLWFIPVLLSIYIIYPFIYELYINKNKWLYVFAVFLLISCFVCGDISSVLKNVSVFETINIMYLSEFNPIKNMNCGMLFYFMLGGWLHRGRKRLDNVSIIKISIIFLIGSIALFIQWFLISKASGSNWDNVFGGYTTTATLLMSSSIFCLVYKGSDKITKCKRLSTYFNVIGNNTLGIYYVHWIVGYTLLRDLGKIYVDDFGIVLNYIKAVVLASVIAYVCKSMKRIPIIRKLL